MIRNLLMLAAAVVLGTGTAAAQAAPPAPPGAAPPASQGAPPPQTPPSQPQPPAVQQPPAPTASQASAQTDSSTSSSEANGIGAGVVEIAAIPVGGAVFLKSNDGVQPRFDNYVFGVSGTVNLSERFGVEGEATYAVGRSQTLTTTTFSLADQKTPSIWLYNADFIVSPLGKNHVLVPYGAVGVGGLTLRGRTDVQPNSPDRGLLGFPNTNDTFFAANVGAGLKWFPIAHWGLRGDYRFMSFDTNNASDNGSTPNRHANRVYGSVIFTY